MKKNIILSIVMLVVTFDALAIIEQYHRNKAYIQAGAPAGGNGSKNKPFNNFADAESSEWKTLKVLPSSEVLVGNLTLKDGQNVKGYCKKEKPVLSSSDTFAVITCNGENKISHLHFNDAWACAIDLTTGTDVCCNNLLITGHNQSQTTYEDWITGGDLEATTLIDLNVAAISAFAEMSETPKASGTITIDNITVENGVGLGVLVESRSAWQVPNPARVNRDVIVTKSTFKNLTVSENSVGYSGGVWVLTSSDNSRATLKTSHCLIDGLFGFAIGFATETARQGIYQSIPLMQIEHCKIFNTNGWHTFSTNFNGGATERQDVIIRHNETANNEDGFVVTQGSGLNAAERPGPGPLFLDYSNNTSKDITVFDGIYYVAYEDSYASLRVENNVFENIADNIVAFVNCADQRNSTQGGTVNAVVKCNKANGFGEGISIWNFDDLAWHQLSVLAEKNCFENGTYGIFDYSSVEDVPPFNQILDAGFGLLGSKGKNSWVNMETDALVVKSNVQAIENWWGTPAGPQNLDIQGGQFLYKPFLTKDPCKKQCVKSHKQDVNQALAQENDPGLVAKVREKAERIAKMADM